MLIKKKTNKHKCKICSQLLYHKYWGIWGRTPDESKHENIDLHQGKNRNLLFSPIVWKFII